jgi:hypothetical protein
LGVGRKADDLALLRNIVTKSKELKTGSNMAEFSEEGYGKKKKLFCEW